MIKNKLVSLGIIAAVSTQVTFASAVDCIAEVVDNSGGLQPGSGARCCIGGEEFCPNEDPDLLAIATVGVRATGEYYLILSPKHDAQRVDVFGFAEEGDPFEVCGISWAPGGDTTSEGCGFYDEDNQRYPIVQMTVYGSDSDG